MPTPVIGGVGLIEKLENAKGFKMKENSDIFLVGRTSGHLDLSLFIHNHFCMPYDLITVCVPFFKNIKDCIIFLFFI